MGNIIALFKRFEIAAIIGYIALESASVSTSKTLGAAGVAGARFFEAPLFFLPEERRRFGVLERRDDLLREADLLFDLRFGVFDRRERRDADLLLVRFLLELLDRAERDRLGAFGVFDRLADFLEGFFTDFDDFFDDFGVRARLLRELRVEDRREREDLWVDALDFERRLGDFGVFARRVLFFEDFLDADLEVDADEARLEPFGVLDRRERREADLLLVRFLLELLDRAERDLDRLGAFGVLDRRAAFLFDEFFDDFPSDFFDDFFDDFGVRARLLLELGFFEERREREELRVDALDFERRLGDFGVLARLLLFFDDFLDADLEVDAGPLGARARRVARRAPLREVLFRRLPFGALGVRARRDDARLEDFPEDLDEERLAFLIFCSPSLLLRERFLLALIPMSMLRFATISALYASWSATYLW